MIIIISANKFFINGIRSLVNMTMSAQRRYSQTLFLDNISDVNDKSLTIARTIIVDYSHPDIQQLAALLYGRCEQVPDMRSSYSSGAHPRG
ncbi:hypothetical protein ACKUD4_24765, partial [Klebsiella pneumoniae]